MVLVKRIILSLFVIGAFIGYSFHERQEGREAIMKVTNSNTKIINPQISDTPGLYSGTPSVSLVEYKDGAYTGSVEDVFYGNIQVRAIISSNQISDIEFLQSPNDRRTSIEINSQAKPLLTQEAISAQSANVDIISGATDSSEGFKRSLANALAKSR